MFFTVEEKQKMLEAMEFFLANQSFRDDEDREAFSELYDKLLKWSNQ